VRAIEEEEVKRRENINTHSEIIANEIYGMLIGEI